LDKIKTRSFAWSLLEIYFAFISVNDAARTAASSSRKHPSANEASKIMNDLGSARAIRRAARVCFSTSAATAAAISLHQCK
jgi:hypothetical protein